MTKNQKKNLAIYDQVTELLKGVVLTEGDKKDNYLFIGLIDDHGAQVSVGGSEAGFTLSLYTLSNETNAVKNAVFDSTTILVSEKNLINGEIIATLLEKDLKPNNMCYCPACTKRRAASKADKSKFNHHIN